MGKDEYIFMFCFSFVFKCCFIYVYIILTSDELTLTLPTMTRKLVLHLAILAARISDLLHITYIKQLLLTHF